MAYKTLEEKMLADYEMLADQFGKALERIKELENSKETETKELAEEPVFIKTISKEVVYLTVRDEYYIKQNKTFKSMSLDEIKEIIENKEKIKSYANSRYEPDSSWSRRGNFVDIETVVFPYTATIQGGCVLISAYQDSEKHLSASCAVLETGQMRENRYFDISRKDEMYEYGLEKFKKYLQEYYERRLKEEDQ